MDAGGIQGLQGAIDAKNLEEADLNWIDEDKRDAVKPFIGGYVAPSWLRQEEDLDELRRRAEAFLATRPASKPGPKPDPDRIAKAAKAYNEATREGRDTRFWVARKLGVKD